MIVLENLRAGYERHVALDGVSCRLGYDRTVAVLGPGGSGKSTLLRIMAGSVMALPPTAWVEGALLGVPASISYLPQRFPCSSLRQPLRALMGSDEPLERALERTWEDIADGALLRSLLDVPLCALPPSLRRLAEVTAALSLHVQMLLLDEPDGGADPRVREWIRRRLATLRGQRSIVLVTHDLALAEAVSDDALFLLDGRLIEASDTASMFTAPVQLRTRDFVTYGG